MSVTGTALLHSSVDGEPRIEPVAPEAVERLAKPDWPSGSSPSR